MLCRYPAVTKDFFFIGIGISIGIGWKLLLTKAAPIASLNLVIVHWSLSSMFQIDPVQSSRSKLTTCPSKGSLLRFE